MYRSNAPIIQTDLLTKRYPKLTAVDAVSLQVEKGEIYGFLGLNGAGKTTTIKMLLGLIKPSSGKLKLFGQSIHQGSAIWNKVGYLVESASAYPNLSVEENLKLIAKLRGGRKEDIENIIAQLSLDRFRHTKAKHLSMGNKQRLSLAKALMHRPALLLLDEPANGLDPSGIVEVRELLQSLAAKGTTIFVSSHILGEIAKIASRIGIIHEGRLIKEVMSNELEEEVIRRVIVDTGDNEQAAAILRSAGYTVSQKQKLELTDESVIREPERVASLLVEKGSPPRELSHYVEDLEHYFLRTIGKIGKA